MKGYHALAIALVSLALSGCQTEEIRGKIERDGMASDQAVHQARAPAPILSHNALEVTDAVWAGAQSVRMRRGLPLPAKLETSRAVALVSSTPLSIEAIASYVAKQASVPVRLEEGVGAEGGRNGAIAGPARAMPVSYEGPLSGLLELVAGHFGATWRYDGAAITFSKYETRVFVIESLPGTQKISEGLTEDTASSASVGSSGSTNAAGAKSSKQTSDMVVEFNFWEDLTKTIETMLRGNGTFRVAPSSGTVTVVTTPEVMRSISKYIEQENDRLSKQVAINVEIYTVDLSSSDDFNMQLSSIMQHLRNFSTSYAGATPAALAGAGQLSVAILDSSTGHNVSPVFQALSTVGNTSRVAQFPMTTLNNRPVVRRIGRDKAYLSSVQVNQSSNFQSTSLTSDIVREGFSLQLTPRILPDGRVLLQYSLGLIDLIDITSFSSGGNSVQLPETSNRVFVQQSLLKSGSTLVLAGFDQDQQSVNAKGVGSPYNMFLGGGMGNTKVRQVMFIAITPQELAVPRMEND